MNNVNIMGRIATDLTLRPVRSSAGVVVISRWLLKNMQAETSSRTLSAAQHGERQQREYAIIFQRAI